MRKHPRNQSNNNLFLTENKQRNARFETIFEFDFNKLKKKNMKKANSLNKIK